MNHIKDLYLFGNLKNNVQYIRLMPKYQLLFLCLKRKEVIHLQREELTEQIGKLNIKIIKANKELDELELKYKKKKLEIRKYKNESVDSVNGYPVFFSRTIIPVPL